MNEQSQNLIKALRGELIDCRCAAWSSNECCCDSVWPEQAARKAADRLEQLEAELSAARAPVERQAPEGWREFLEQCAGFGGAMVSGNDLSRKASRLLFDAGPSAQGREG